MEKVYLYVDDKRTTIDDKWTIVRNYNEFVSFIKKNGVDNIAMISFDHDLGDINSEFEKTGMDCAKFLINYLMDNDCTIPKMYVHSDNNVGAKNIVSYINNYLKTNYLNETCQRIVVGYTV